MYIVHQTLKELTITATTCNILHAAGYFNQNNILVREISPEKKLLFSLSDALNALHCYTCMDWIYASNCK